MSNSKNEIIKYIEKIDKIVENVDYSYVKLEIEAKNQSYIIEKNKNKPIGFQSG